MRKPLHDLNDVFLFVKVVEHGGYSAAARSLGQQASGISRRIARLEQELGVQLLNRSSRSVALTAVGQDFHDRCVGMLAAMDEARDVIDQSVAQPRGHVRISCPIGLLHSDVAAIVHRYLREHRDVQVSVDATNRRVDVVEEGLDIAIRVRTPPLDDSELAMRPLARSEFILVASPSLQPPPGELQDPQDIARVPTLDMARLSGVHAWAFERAGAPAQVVAHRPRLVTDDLGMLAAAAVAGLGIALVPRSIARAELAAGRLVQVFPQFQMPAGAIHAVFPARRGRVPAVRALLDALVAGFANGESRDTNPAVPPLP